MDFTEKARRVEISGRKEKVSSAFQKNCRGEISSGFYKSSTV